MNRPKLSIRTKPTQWTIEKSFVFLTDKLVEFANMPELRSWMTSVASRQRFDVGELFYRYELNSRDEAEVVHVYFEDRHSKRKRFMRLRRS